MLVVPILHRGLRDRSWDLKKRTSRIVGSMCQLINEPKVRLWVLSSECSKHAHCAPRPEGPIRRSEEMGLPHRGQHVPAHQRAQGKVTEACHSAVLDFPRVHCKCSPCPTCIPGLHACFVWKKDAQEGDRPLATTIDALARASHIELHNRHVMLDVQPYMPLFMPVPCKPPLSLAASSTKRPVHITHLVMFESYPCSCLSCHTPLHPRHQSPRHPQGPLHNRGHNLRPRPLQKACITPNACMLMPSFCGAGHAALRALDHARAASRPCQDRPEFHAFSRHPSQQKA